MKGAMAQRGENGKGHFVTRSIENRNGGNGIYSKKVLGLTFSGKGRPGGRPGLFNAVMRSRNEKWHAKRIALSIALDILLFCQKSVGGTIHKTRHFSG